MAGQQQAAQSSAEEPMSFTDRIRLAPIVVRGFHRGMADATVMSDGMMPESMLRLILNMDTDSIGFLTRRNGFAKLGSGAVVGSTPIRGLYQHGGTNSKLIAFADTATCNSYYLAGSAWTIKNLGFTIGNKVRAKDFLGRVFAVNGVDNPKSWDGAVGTNWDSTNLTAAPIGSFIEEYKQQLFIVNTNGKVSFSSLPDSSATTITWPTANNFFVDPNNGTNMTAAIRYGQEFVLFKNNFMYRYNSQSIDADPIIEFGTPSQESVVAAAGTLFFYDAIKNTVCAYSGGFPKIISKPVRGFFNAIPNSAKSSVTLRGDFDHVEAFIGTITYDGVTYTNAAARYVISTQTWVIRAYDKAFNVAILYDDGTTTSSIQGTTDGFVETMDSGNDDDGTGIDFRAETPFYSVQANPGMILQMTSFLALVENPSGDMTVFTKTDIERDMFRPLGGVRAYAEAFDHIDIQPFHRIKFLFTGVSSSTEEPTIIDGFVMQVPQVLSLETKSSNYPF